MKLSAQIISISLLVLIIQSCGNQKTATQQVVFYNVENLFDTLDTPDKDDAEFLPGSKNDWNSAKYNEKLAHINEVINQFEHPVIIGMCEIENAQVVKDVVANGKLKKDYEVIHFESLDARGIDNAIIYDSKELKMLQSGFLRFVMPDGDSPSRDIVWAKFKQDKDSLYVMVNHWPSRRGGEVESEPKRIVASNAAKSFIDSLQAQNAQVKIIFMGDLNDYPTNIAPKQIAEVLTPMITPASGKFGGSHNYRGEWNVLDHIMVSKPMIESAGIHTEVNSGKINSFDFLLTTYKEEIVPFRTYGGGNYLKGYSDHLPVSIEITCP